ncbi:DUF3160 domain-containing protein [bacterium]|nr:DUF3160 domain-containing protein [bacterium]
MNMNRISAAVALLCTVVSVSPLRGESFPPITSDVTTDFAVYKPYTVTVTPSVKPYTISSDLSEVANIADFTLSKEAKALLAVNGFVAEASRYRQIYDVYNGCESNGIPAFVTTDACLHTYHILYDYMLRILELRFFFADLDGLTMELRKASMEMYESAADPEIRQAALDNISYFSVPFGLLHPEASSIDANAIKEINAIYEGSSGYVPSTLMYREDYPYVEDYSQYKPRGHYTRTTEFEEYFRAMMWYGRMTFSLNLPYAKQEGLRHAARQALLISRMLETVTVDNEAASAVWERIYEPTVFFVGKTDDITFRSYIEIAREVFGEDFLDQSPDVLADNDKIDMFIAKALTLPDPKITVKAGKGLRFMGQRFIPDSYILDHLVEEFVRNRFMPRGLDVMAVLGSERAYDILRTVYKDTEYPKYIDQMEALRKEFHGCPPETWAQNLYYNWLYTLLPLLDIKGEGYPPFMQTPAWVDKDLNTALGSWAELRHDTILYAKQSETLEVSAEPPVPPFARGYVEPNPEVYARLVSLAGYMKTGLNNRGLYDNLISDRIDQFRKLMTALTEISVKELTNTTPTPDEYALICNFGGAIESIVTFPPEFSAQYENDADKYLAVIADVHTDPNTNTCLEVGVGHPLTVYVIAPVEGVPTLTKGALFAYHEFTWSLSEGRLTDEEWQKMQSSSGAQDMPVWTESFRNGPSSAGVETFSVHGNPGMVTAVDEKPAPVDFNLLQNTPNPFNPSTLITFDLEKDETVKVAVYNLSGQEVEVLLDSRLNAGRHTLTWAPGGLASGVYFIRLITGTHAGTIRAVYLK